MYNVLVGCFWSRIQEPKFVQRHVNCMMARKLCPTITATNKMHRDRIWCCGTASTVFPTWFPQCRLETITASGMDVLLTQFQLRVQVVVIFIEFPYSGNARARLDIVAEKYSLAAVYSMAWELAENCNKMYLVQASWDLHYEGRDCKARNQRAGKKCLRLFPSAKFRSELSGRKESASCTGAKLTVLLQESAGSERLRGDMRRIFVVLISSTVLGRESRWAQSIKNKYLFETLDSRVSI